MKVRLQQVQLVVQLVVQLEQVPQLRVLLPVERWELAHQQVLTQVQQEQHLSQR
jgi:hypothetical protein